MLLAASALARRVHQIAPLATDDFVKSVVSHFSENIADWREVLVPCDICDQEAEIGYQYELWDEDSDEFEVAVSPRCRFHKAEKKIFVNSQDGSRRITGVVTDLYELFLRNNEEMIEFFDYLVMKRRSQYTYEDQLEYQKKRTEVVVDWVLHHKYAQKIFFHARSTPSGKLVAESVSELREILRRNLDQQKSIAMEAGRKRKPSRKPLMVYEHVKPEVKNGCALGEHKPHCLHCILEEKRMQRIKIPYTRDTRSKTRAFTRDFRRLCELDKGLPDWWIEMLKSVDYGVEDMPQIEDEETALPEFAHETPNVGGAGYCWTKLFWLHPFLKDQKNVMTAKTLVAETRKRPHIMKTDIHIDFDWQPDNDLHIIGIAMQLPSEKAANLWHQTPNFNWEEAVTLESFLQSCEEAIRDADELMEKKLRASELLVGAQSALDKALGNFVVPESKRTLEALHLAQVTEEVNQARKICPYAIPKELTDLAVELGLPFTANCPVAHSHPLHAALRRRQLFKIFPDLIKADCTVVSMKQDNFQMLANAMSTARRQVELKVVNPLVTVKDFCRYANDGTVPDDVFRLPKVETPMVLFDDSGHYMQPSELLGFFDDNPKVQVAIISHVYPLAALGSDYSPHPHAYEFKRVGNTLIYIPEKDVGGQYEQPLDPALLLARSISDKQHRLSLHGGVVDSKLNSHVQVWTRYNLQAPQFVPLYVPEVMLLPRIFRSQPASEVYIPVEYYQKLYQYAKVLKTARSEDLWGKMRQFSDTQNYHLPISTLEWLIKVVLEAASFNLTPNLQTKSFTNVVDEMWYKTFGHLRRIKHKMFNVRYANRLSRLIDEPHPVQPIPALDLTVKKDHHGYGLRWELPPEVSLKLLVLFRNWLSRLYKRNEKDEVSEYVKRDSEGALIWEGMISFTKPNEMEVGAEWIRAVQKASYQNNFEDSKPYQNPTGNVIPKPVPIQRMPPPLPPRPDPGDQWDFTDSEVSSDTDTTSSRSTNPWDRQQANRMWNRIVGIEDVPPKPGYWKLRQLQSELMEFSIQTPEIATTTTAKTLTSYATDSENPPESTEHIPRLQKRDSREGLTLMSESVNWDYVREEIVNHGHAKPPDTESVSLPTVEKEPDLWHMSDVQPAPIPVSVFRRIPEEVPPKTAKGQNRSRTSKECREEWDKYLRTMPTTGRNLTHNYHGAALWDALYPDTFDRRHREIPYREVTMWARHEWPTGDCLIEALHQSTGIAREKIYMSMLRVWPKNQNDVVMLTVDNLDAFALHYGLNVEVWSEKTCIGKYGVKIGTPFVLNLEDGDFTANLKARPPLTIRDPRPATHSGKSYRMMVQELLSLPTVTRQEYQPSPKLASLLIRAWQNQETGLLGKNPANHERLKGWEDQVAMLAKSSSKPRWVTVIEGDPGCRKSSAIQKVLRKMQYKIDNNYMVVLPTTTLREDWSRKLGMQDKHAKTGKGTPASFCCTFEKAIAEQYTGKVMVLDEDKFPKGYVDFMMLMNPTIEWVIMLSDRYQCEWHEPDDRCTLNDTLIPGNLRQLSPYLTQYLLGTWRFGPNIANFFRMPTWSHNKGGFHFSNQAPTAYQDLRPFFGHMSDGELKELWEKETEHFHGKHTQKVWAEEMMGREVDTFAGSQGITAKLAIITLDRSVLRLTNLNMLYTVMTRAEDVIFVLDYVTNQSTNMDVSANPILAPLMRMKARYVTGRPATVDLEDTVDIKALIGPLNTNIPLVLAGPLDKVANPEVLQRWYPQITRSIDPDRAVHKGGARLRWHTGFYADHPEFKPYIDETLEVIEEEVIVREVVPRAPKLPTHLPPPHVESLEEAMDAQVVERFDRELSWGKIYSSQLPDTYQHVSNVPEVRKKLKAKLAKGQPARKANLIVNKHLQSLPDSENPTLFHPRKLNWGLAQSSQDNASFAAGVAQRIRRCGYLQNKAEYTEHESFGLELHRALKRVMGWSADPIPWDPLLYERSVQEFQERRADRSESLKRMSLNRADPDYGSFLTAKSQWKMKSETPEKAKALQTILVQGDEYLFKFGPYGIYCLHKLLENCPPNIYFHARKSIEEMEAWVAAYDTEEPWTIVDVTGWDGSYRGGQLYNWQLVLQHFSLPQEIIDDWIHRRLDTSITAFHMGIMMFSGWIETWMGNSIGSLSLQAYKYELPYGIPMMVSGDDVTYKGKWTLGLSYLEHQMFDFAEEKRYESDRGEFCSFMIINGRLYKNPKLLFLRLQGQISRGKLKDVYDGYFLMWALNYVKGEHVATDLTEEEQEYQAALSRLFFNLRRISRVNLHVDWSRVDASENEKNVLTPSIVTGLFEAFTQVQQDPTPLNDAGVLDYYTQSFSFVPVEDE